MTPRCLRLAVAAVAAVALVCCLEARAQPSLAAGNHPAVPGSPASVRAYLQNVTNLAALQFDLSWDPARATSGDAGTGTGVLSNHIVRSRQILPGLHRVLVFSRGPGAVTVSNTSAAAAVPMTLAPGEPDTSGPILPRNVILAQPDATAIQPVTVTPGTLFTRPVLNSAGAARVFLPAVPGTNHVFQATTNLVHWTSLETNLAPSEFIEFIDPEAGLFPFRFYRALR